MAESIHADRHQRRAEHFGLAEPESASDELSMSNTKAELLEAAEGLDVDETNTKAEILEALEE